MFNFFFLGFNVSSMMNVDVEEDEEVKERG